MKILLWLTLILLSACSETIDPKIAAKTDACEVFQTGEGTLNKYEAGVYCKDIVSKERKMSLYEFAMNRPDSQFLFGLCSRKADELRQEVGLTKATPSDCYQSIEAIHKIDLMERGDRITLSIEILEVLIVKHKENPNTAEILDFFSMAVEELYSSLAPYDAQISLIYLLSNHNDLPHPIQDIIGTLSQKNDSQQSDRRWFRIAKKLQSPSILVCEKVAHQPRVKNNCN